MPQRCVFENQCSEENSKDQKLRERVRDSNKFIQLISCFLFLGSVRTVCLCVYSLLLSHKSTAQPQRVDRASSNGHIQISRNQEISYPEVYWSPGGTLRRWHPIPGLMQAERGSWKDIMVDPVAGLRSRLQSRFLRSKMQGQTGLQMKEGWQKQGKAPP